MKCHYRKCHFENTITKYKKVNPSVTIVIFLSVMYQHNVVNLHRLYSNRDYLVNGVPFKYDQTLKALLNKSVLKNFLLATASSVVDSSPLRISYCLRF